MIGFKATQSQRLAKKYCPTPVLRLPPQKFWSSYVLETNVHFGAFFDIWLGFFDGWNKTAKTKQKYHTQQICKQARG